jgi:2-amino-4-hydroxy-6-hydroxymethyldihydropteridine diphosphokinase
MKEIIAYIGIGSNIGDRLSYVQQSVAMLSSFEGVKILDTSGFYETEPYGYKEQNWFVNAVAKIETTLSPVELLRICQSVEEKLGRSEAKKGTENHRFGYSFVWRCCYSKRIFDHSSPRNDRQSICSCSDA